MANDPKAQKEIERLKKLLEESRTREKEQARELQSLRDRNAALNGKTITVEEHEKIIKDTTAEFTKTVETRLKPAEKALRGLGAEFHPAKAGNPEFYSIRGMAPGSVMRAYDAKIEESDSLRKKLSALEAEVRVANANREFAEKRVKELEAMEFDSKKLRERLRNKEEEVKTANSRANKFQQEIDGFRKTTDNALREVAYTRYRIDQVRGVKRDDAVTHAAAAFKFFALWLMREKGMTREEAGVFVERATTAYYGSIDLSMAAVLDAADIEITEQRKDNEFADEVRGKIAAGEIVPPEDGLDIKVLRNSAGDGKRAFKWFKPPVKIEKAPAEAKAS